MANVKISALPAATSVAAADTLPIVQSATTKKATFGDVAGAVGGVRVYASAAARNSAITSPTEGMCVYLTDEDTLQIYTGSAWVAVGATKMVSGTTEGLVWISNTTIGSAVASVTVANCFSSSYDAYRIIVSGGAASGTTYLNLRTGLNTGVESGTVYQYSFMYTNLANTPLAGGTATATDFHYVGQADTSGITAVIDIVSPYVASKTMITTPVAAMGSFAGWSTGMINTTTQYTHLTIYANAGTLTGGTVSIYGYRKS